MEKTLYLLSISLIFFSCSKDSTNSATGTIQDVVGTYQYVADYSASNIQQPASTTPGYTACQQQSNITLDINNNGISEDYSLEDEMSGPCVSYSFTFDFNYINSTTLEFIIAQSSCSSHTVTITSNGDLKIPYCTSDGNGDPGSFDGDYSLWEKIP